MHDKNDAFVGWTIPFYVRIHARPQYNYVCSIFFLFCCFQKVLVMSCCKSACYKQVSKKCKKNQMICLAVRLKPPTFASAIERDAALQTVCDWLGETNVGEFSLTAVCTQYLTLAGLRERERIRPGEDGRPAFYGSFEKKTFSKKTFENIWWLR